MVSMEEYLYMNMSDTDSDDEEEEAIAVETRPRVKYDKAFTLTTTQFVKRYRLTKPLVRDLIEEVRPLVSPPYREGDLTVEIKVLAALNFFAKGSYQLNIGNHKNISISQSSVSKALTEVAEALNHPAIFNKYVKFPSSPLELTAIAKRFYQLYGLPGVVGCIDCTHVAIVAPPNNEQYDERSYVNRKGYHSINTQLICDADLNIINANALFPGCTHDSYIWNNSTVKPLMEEIQERVGSFYLIGDSGYALRPWLQVPISEPSNNAELKYNEAFKSVRATIERCNGVLKGRFRCVLMHRVLHYSPEKATKIINSCVVLHNICNKNNVQTVSDESDDDDVQVDFGVYNVEPPQEASGNNGLTAGHALRASIVNNYFN